jgi:predicted CopG family antitoxin
MYCKYKNIAVSQTNYQKLKRLGTAGDSFNDVITEIIKKLQNGQRLATVHQSVVGTKTISEDSSGHE